MTIDIIDRLAGAVYPAFALLAGMELDVFTPLKDGPLTADELGAVLEVEPRRLQPLLYALVRTGLLHVEGEHFANSPEADRCLVRGRPQYCGQEAQLMRDLWTAGMSITESVRSGRPQAQHNFSEMAQGELANFLGGLHPGALQAGRDLAEVIDLGDCQRVLDVAGGSGGMALALSEAWPHLLLTVAELANVAPLTRQFVQAAGAAQRVEVVEADLRHQVLPGDFGAAIAKAFIQTLGPADARRALENIGRSLIPGASLFILGSGIVEDSRLAPEGNVYFNPVFVSCYRDGQAYTVAQYRQWLELAGFEDIVWQGGMLRAKKRMPPG